MKSLQLPKNKFVRLAINVIFILFWSWFFISYLYYYWLFIIHTPIFNFLKCGIISGESLGSDSIPACIGQVYGYGIFSNIIDWIALIWPSLLLTKFIWFTKRPKIIHQKIK